METSIIIVNYNSRPCLEACLESLMTNTGIYMAKGKFLVTMNPDVLVPKGWLARMIWHLMNNPKTLAVGPKGIGISGRQAALPLCYPVNWRRLIVNSLIFTAINRNRSNI